MHENYKDNKCKVQGKLNLFYLLKGSKLLGRCNINVIPFPSQSPCHRKSTLGHCVLLRGFKFMKSMKQVEIAGSSGKTKY